MNRRALLVTIAGGCSVGAGCLGNGRDGAKPPSSRTNRERDTAVEPPSETRSTRPAATERDTAAGPPSATAAPTFFTLGPGDEAPRKAASVGDPSKLPEGDVPHEVFVWNDAATARPVRVRVAGKGDNPPFEREYRLDADAYVALTLLTPDRYTITLRIDGKRRRPVKIARSFFDCNESQTKIRVAPDGSVTSNTITTLAGCGTAVTTG